LDALEVASIESEPAWRPDVFDAAGRLARRMSALTRSALDDAGSDVTAAQFEVLAHLAAGVTGPGVLATVLGVDASAVTRMCDRLVERDLLVRLVSDVSRREVVLELTPAARRLVDAVGRSRVRAAEVALGVGADGVVDLAGLLDRLTGRLSAAERVEVAGAG
jgi:DNA-binding MarR family transcriptional regulator